MADDEDSEEPTVTLGAKQAVEGAPLARVSARLMWGIEKSAIIDREGDTVIRTPDGPRELADVLANVEKTYFATRQEFEGAIEGVLGDGPIPSESSEEGEESDPAEEDTDGDHDEPTAEDADESDVAESADKGTDEASEEGDETDTASNEEDETDTDEE